MPFTISDWGDSLKYTTEKRNRYPVTFESTDLHDCLGFCWNKPEESEITIPYFGRADKAAVEWECDFFDADDFRYRDIFERWVADYQNGKPRREILTIEINKEKTQTPLMIAVSISPYEMCCWGQSDYPEQFRVGFIIDKYPYAPLLDENRSLHQADSQQLQ